MNKLAKAYNFTILSYGILMFLALFLPYMLFSYSSRVAIGGSILILVLLLGLLLKPEFLLGMVFLSLMGGSTYYWARDFYYVRFLFLGAFLVKGLVELARRREQIRSFPTRFLIPLGLFSTFALISTFYSINSSMTIQRATTLFLLIFALGIYLWNYLDSEEKIERMLDILIGIMIIGVVGSLVAWWLGAPAVESGGEFRGLFIDPNTMGGLFMLTTLPLFWRYGKSHNIWLGIATILFICLLVLTGSRASILGVFFSFLLYFFLVDRKRILGLAIMFGLLTSFLLLSQGQLPGGRFFINRIVQPTSLWRASGRWEVWAASFDLFLKKPWFGYGFGAVETVFSRFLPPWVPGNFRGANPHSSYLETLLELGAFGLILLLVPVFLVLKKGFELHTRFREETLSICRLNAMLTAVIIGVAIHSMFESVITSVGSVFAIPFWLYVISVFKLDELSLRKGQSTESN